MLPTTMTKPLRLSQLRKTEVRRGVAGTVDDSGFMICDLPVIFYAGAGSYHLAPIIIRFEKGFRPSKFAKEWPSFDLLKTTMG
jgi:hypothetical protein